jgi:hypothetical protein
VAIHNIVLEFIIIHRFLATASSEANPFIFVIYCCTVILIFFCVGESTTNSGHPQLGLRRVHLIESTPDRGSSGEPKDMSENIHDKGVDGKTDNLLIPRDPCIICRIGNGDLLLVFIFSIKEFMQTKVGSLKETHYPCT